MKKKILLSLLVIIGLFIITGCKNENNSQSNNTKQDNGKSYNINGVSIKLDKDDNRDNIKYKISSSFTRKFSTTTSTYTIYKDNNKDKYDLSNVIFRLDVNVDTMNSESKIEREKQLVNAKDSFKNIEQSQKTINETTWEYFSFDNMNDASNSFKEHLYITEKKVDKYYYIYKVYFSFSDEINDFENAFMDSIVFE